MLTLFILAIVASNHEDYFVIHFDVVKDLEVHIAVSSAERKWEIIAFLYKKSGLIDSLINFQFSQKWRPCSHQVGLQKVGDEIINS